MDRLKELRGGRDIGDGNKLKQNGGLICRREMLREMSHGPVARIYERRHIIMLDNDRWESEKESNTPVESRYNLMFQVVIISFQLSSDNH